MKEIEIMKNLNYISQLINEETEFNGELLKLRILVHSRKVDEKTTLLAFKKLIGKYPSNPRVLKSFLNFLQLLNNDDLLKRFTLKDIR